MARYKEAPRIDLSRPSDALDVIADASGISGSTEDLRARSKMPKHAPQMLTLIGDSSAQSIVLRQEDLENATNIDKTIKVPANGMVVITRPIKAIVKSGSGTVQVVCEWWVGSSSDEVWNT